MTLFASSFASSQPVIYY